MNATDLNATEPSLLKRQTQSLSRTTLAADRRSSLTDALAVHRRDRASQSSAATPTRRWIDPVLRWFSDESSDRSRRVTSRAAASVLPLSPSQPARGRLSANDPLNRQRRNRYSDDYALSGLTAGQQVRIDLSSIDFDAYLQVVNADTGRVLGQNDDRADNTSNASLTLMVQPGVNYRVRVTSYDVREVGRYTLRVSNAATTLLFNYDYGYGLVDAAKAVASAIGWNPFADVPDLGGTQWELDMIKAPEVWAQGFTGQGVTVAVLDTGVDYTHPDLQANIWQNPGEIAGNGLDDDQNGFVDDIHGWSFVDDDSNDPMDSDQHGTHVSGTIAAANNGFGVTGVAYDAKIMPIRVIDGRDDNYPQRFDANVAAGIRYAVQNGARVINMSLGNYVGDPVMVQTRTALQEAFQAGVVAVMASGNERQEGATRPIEPAYFARAGLGIAVGAVSQRRRVADFSNPAGNRPLSFVVAPGVNVYSTIPGGQYEGGWSGTSMATPHVVGVVALMLSANPSLTPAQVGSILQTTANPAGLFGLA